MAFRPQLCFSSRPRKAAKPDKQHRGWHQDQRHCLTTLCPSTDRSVETTMHPLLFQALIVPFFLLLYPILSCGQNDLSLPLPVHGHLDCFQLTALYFYILTMQIGSNSSSIYRVLFYSFPSTIFSTVDFFNCIFLLPFVLLTPPLQAPHCCPCPWVLFLFSHHFW